MENIELYNNQGLKTAIKGLIPRICRTAKGIGEKLSPNMLRRYCQPYQAEYGRSAYATVKLIIYCLARISRSRAEFLLADLFAALPERARYLWKREEWLERVFASIGQLQAYLVRGRWDKAGLERFQLAELLTAEIV